MTLKVVQGLVGNRALDPSSNNLAAQAARGDSVGNSAGQAAKTLGSVAGSEAAVTTLRSSRQGAGESSKLRDADKAENLARDVAQKIGEDEKLAASLHSGLSGTDAQDLL